MPKVTLTVTASASGVAAGDTLRVTIPTSEYRAVDGLRDDGKDWYAYHPDVGTYPAVAIVGDDYTTVYFAAAVAISSSGTNSDHILRFGNQDRGLPRLIAARDWSKWDVAASGPASDHLLRPVMWIDEWTKFRGASGDYDSDSFSDSLDYIVSGTWVAENGVLKYRTPSSSATGRVSVDLGGLTGPWTVLGQFQEFTGQSGFQSRGVAISGSGANIMGFSHRITDLTLLDEFTPAANVGSIPTGVGQHILDLTAEGSGSSWQIEATYRKKGEASGTFVQSTLLSSLAEFGLFSATTSSDPLESDNFGPLIIANVSDATVAASVNPLVLPCPSPGTSRSILTPKARNDRGEWPMSQTQLLTGSDLRKVKQFEVRYQAIPSEDFYDILLAHSLTRSVLPVTLPLEDGSNVQGRILPGSFEAITGKDGHTISFGLRSRVG